MVNIPLSEEMEKILSRICQISKKSQSSVVQEILETNLQEVHDYYLALSRLEEKEPSISLADAKKQLGFEDRT